jgi:hypothetical protein
MSATSRPCEQVFLGGDRQDLDLVAEILHRTLQEALGVALKTAEQQCGFVAFFLEEGAGL